MENIAKNVVYDLAHTNKKLETIAKKYGLETGYCDQAKFIILPGFKVSDEISDIKTHHTKTAKQAAEEYVKKSEWIEEDSTQFLSISVWQVGVSKNPSEDSGIEYRGLNEVTFTIPLEPKEPKCTYEDQSFKNHNWKTLRELVGGCADNPSIFSNGGGVRIVELCTNCGTKRVSDTLSIHPETGKRDLENITYYKKAYSLEDIADVYRNDK
jgi:hypothetical protein